LGIFFILVLAGAATLFSKENAVRYLPTLDLLQLSRAEWDSILPHLITLGYLPKKHNVLLAPHDVQRGSVVHYPLPTCVGEYREGHFYLDGRVLPDLTPVLNR
jgi:hypothetical protein